MPLVDADFRGQIDATVFVPTFNGETYLDRLLTAVELQLFDGNFEILVIDSGSRDATLSILAQHPAVRVVTIDQQDFGHGKTRNHAAQLARGEYIAYLSHDAIPVGHDWLRALIAPLWSAKAGGNDVQAVFGKHIARKNSFPLMKYGIEGVFAACGPDGVVTVVDGKAGSVTDLDPTQAFYSDVCSATSRAFLLETIPYRDVSYAEDLAFAQDLLAAGFLKAYQPGAVVEHSNDVTRAEFGQRTFDEYLGMRKLGQTRSGMSLAGAWARIARDVVSTSIRILRDSDYSVSRKLYWLFVNPSYVVTKWLAVRRALNISLNDTARIARYSLEANRA